MPACFQCGLAVPPGVRNGVEVHGRWRPMCCPGCEAVAMTILGQGLGDFYRLRSSLAAVDPGVAVAPDIGGLELYDDPLIQRTFVTRSADGASCEATLLLEGVRCSACVWLLEKTITALPGIQAVGVSYSTRRAILRWDSRMLRVSQILSAIKGIGYDAWPADPQHIDTVRRKERRDALWRIFVAGFGMMQVMMYALPTYLADAGDMTWDVEQLMRWASCLVTLPVVVYSAGPFFAGAIRDLRAGRAGMDVPVSLGVGIGFVASLYATVIGQGAVYFDSIAMFVFLLLGGRYLELLGRQKATGALDHLGRLKPMRANLVTGKIEEGQSELVSAVSLVPGQTVVVKPGELVPADGQLLSVDAELDESLMTGESRPMRRTQGEFIVAGAVNVGSPIFMRVERIGSETVISSIERMVNRANGEMSRLADLANRAAGYFVLLVLFLSVIAAGFWWQVGAEKAIWVAISVLVATCPCAFSLATPVALTVAGGEFARRGVATGKSHLIETLSRSTDVVFDKTGTLTRGEPTISSVSDLRGLGEARIIEIARALESGTEHPVARALGKLAAQFKLNATVAHELRTFPGRGVEGCVDGELYRVGTLSFVAESFPAGSAAAVISGSAIDDGVFVGDRAGLVGKFSTGDSHRPEAPWVVANLRALGLRVHMLSGDSTGEVRRVALLCGIDSYQARVLPGEKQSFVTGLRSCGKSVVMIGDGLNDAPVLAAADASFAMGSGAILSQLSADAVILGGSLESVTGAIQLSRQTMAIIRQNIAWSFAYNLLVLPAALAGWLSPWMAGLGMSVSSLVVVLNALRIGRSDHRFQIYASSPRSIAVT